jgi:hypothetical protein
MYKNQEIQFLHTFKNLLPKDNTNVTAQLLLMLAQKRQMFVLFEQL